MTRGDVGDDGDPTPARFDVAVIGATLPGLIAALRLRAAGYSTIVLEPEPSIGGACGTFVEDGFVFDRGCNDFSTNLARELDELGVDVAFERKHTRIYFGEDAVDLPPSAALVARLVLRVPLLARRPAMSRVGDLEALSKLGADASREHEANTASTSPACGPQHLIDRTLDRFCALGGRAVVRCGAIRHRLASSAHELRLTSSNETVLASTLLVHESAEETPQRFSTLLFATRGDAPWPAEVETLGCFMPDLRDQLLASGEIVESDVFSFHVIRTNLGEPEGAPKTFVGFVARRSPRPLTEDERRDVLVFARRALDRVVPGFADALLYAKLLSPDEALARARFAALRSAEGVWWSQLASDPATSATTFSLGAMALPPASCASNAVFVGRRAAERVAAALEQRPDLAASRRRAANDNGDDGSMRRR
ncbi:MAG: FAD-dependent oxidoreductase [Myxococcales bacterium]|nr:FAD-dependent oxidoreductase [Myxococcales bacterium]